jgi:SHS2 domain-containing protein
MTCGRVETKHDRGTWGRRHEGMKATTRPHWEHFPHIADMGVRGYGHNPAQAFEQAALALTAVIVEPHRVRVRTTIDIECEAPDLELLFLDWLNALVYEMATRHMLFRDYAVTIADHRLQAKVGGEAMEITRHRPAVEVKGATLTQLSVVQRGSGDWIAQCVVDV